MAWGETCFLPVGGNKVLIAVTVQCQPDFFPTVQKYLAQQLGVDSLGTYTTCQGMSGLDMGREVFIQYSYELNILPYELPEDEKRNGVTLSERQIKAELYAA